MPKSVFIVEDEFIIALDLTLVLEGHGWTVIGPVGSINEALLLLEQTTPSVAVLDVNLSDGLVTSIAEALRARNIPFVMASAHGPETIGGDVLAGAPNVGKPTDEHRLVAALEKLLAN